jgi:tellurite methyltransferase
MTARLTLSIFCLSLACTGAGVPAWSAPPSGLSGYEAVTGDSPDEERSIWDSFYEHKSNVFGKEAVGFLKENLHRVRKGRAFVPAMGEGRNAVYLARHGFQVDGVDLSPIAVDRAVELARSQHVSVKGIVADLTNYAYPLQAYDFVFVSLFYMEQLIPKFKQVVKPGGHIMVYVKADTGKPSAGNTPDDFLVKNSTLKAAFKDFQTLSFKEYRDHGVDVIAILARRP